MAANATFYRNQDADPLPAGTVAWYRTAHKYTLTFSGVVLCTACVGQNKVTGGTLDGAFIVTREAGTCSWRYTETPPTTVTASSYSNAICTTGATAYTSLRIRLRYVSGVGWTVTASINSVAADNGELFSGTTATVTATGVSNANTVCDGIDLGHSGSVTWAPYL